MDKDILHVKIVLAEKKTNKQLDDQLGCTLTIVPKWSIKSYQPPLETYQKIAECLMLNKQNM